MLILKTILAAYCQGSIHSNLFCKLMFFHTDPHCRRHFSLVRSFADNSSISSSIVTSIFIEVKNYFILAISLDVLQTINAVGFVIDFYLLLLRPIMETAVQGTYTLHSRSEIVRILNMRIGFFCLQTF